MSTPLFRPEAFAAEQDKHFGEALMIRPISWRLCTYSVAGLTALLLSYACAAHYTRHEHVSGYLVPDLGLVTVAAQQTGVVQERYVAEGDIVRRGARLYAISSDHAIADAASAEALALQTLERRRVLLKTSMVKQASINRIDRDSLAAQIRSTTEEIGMLVTQMAMQQQRISNASAAVERYRKLVADRFVSEAQLQAQQDALLEQQNRQQELVRARGGLERDLGALKHTAAASDYRGANSETALEAEIQALDQQLAEYEARRNAVVTAPRDGRVTAVLLEPGQRAEAAQPLLSILPAGSTLTAQLLIPSRAAGFIRLDQSVSLRYDAFPYQRFGSYTGHVVQVDRTILTHDLPGMPMRINEPVYRATVRLASQQVTAYGAPVALQAGMLLSADIAVDRRSLLEWLLDPLYSLSKG